MSDKIITWHQYSSNCPHLKWKDSKSYCSKLIHNEKCNKNVISCDWKYLRNAPIKEATKWVIAFIAGLIVMGGIWLGWQQLI